MYEIMMFGCVSIIGIWGIFMAVAPKLVVKKSIIDDPSKLMKTRIYGLFMAVACIVALIMMSNMGYIFS